MARLHRLAAPLLVTALLTFTGGVAAADAEPAYAHSGAQHGDFTERHAEMRARLEAEMAQLGLTDAQQQDLAMLGQLYGERIAAIVRRGEADRQELMQLSPLDPDYDTLTNQVSQEAAAASAEVVNALSELQRTAFLLLSNEQQDEFLRLRAERQQELRERIAAKRAERAAAQAPAAP